MRGINARALERRREKRFGAVTVDKMITPRERLCVTCRLLSNGKKGRRLNQRSMFTGDSG